MTVRPSDLQAIPLFHGITDAHLAELMGAFERRSHPAGEVLFEAGSEPTHLLLLASGEVILNERGNGAVGQHGGHPHTPAPRFRLLVAARLDVVPPRHERFGERDKRRLGAPERPRPCRRPVERDAVIRHNHMRHHSRSSRAFR